MHSEKHGTVLGRRPDATKQTKLRSRRVELYIHTAGTFCSQTEAAHQPLGGTASSKRKASPELCHEPSATARCLLQFAWSLFSLSWLALRHRGSAMTRASDRRAVTLLRRSRAPSRDLLDVSAVAAAKLRYHLRPPHQHQPSLHARETANPRPAYSGASMRRATI